MKKLRLLIRATFDFENLNDMKDAAECASEAVEKLREQGEVHESSMEIVDDGKLRAIGGRP